MKKDKVLIIGFFGSKERHFKCLVDYYESSGYEVKLMIPKLSCVLRYKNNMKLVSKINKAISDDKFILHVFSQSKVTCGFLFASGFYKKYLSENHVATILDSVNIVNDVPWAKRAINNTIGGLAAKVINSLILPFFMPNINFYGPISDKGFASNDKPMLFLHSVKDPIAPISAVKDFVENRKLEKPFKVVEFEEANHVQLLRFEKSLYTKSIENFLQGIES